MRYPLAIWTSGPPEKAGYAGRTVNTVWGAICHSMVGAYAGALSRLMGPDRASWHFSVLKNGDVFQHYDTTVVCWHAGDAAVNGGYVGIEHEGGGPGNEREPLTPEQLAASVKLVRWLSETHGFPLNREHLREHNEVYATACPSGRIPWAEYEEDGMDAETRAAIGAILTQLGKLGKDDTMIMKVLEERMDALDARLAGAAAELVRAGKALGG